MAAAIVPRHCGEEAKRSRRRTTNGNAMQITEGEGVFAGGRMMDGSSPLPSTVLKYHVYKHPHYALPSLVPGSPQW